MEISVVYCSMSVDLFLFLLHAWKQWEHSAILLELQYTLKCIHIRESLKKLNKRTSKSTDHLCLCCYNVSLIITNSLNMLYTKLYVRRPQYLLSDTKWLDTCMHVNAKFRAADLCVCIRRKLIYNASIIQIMKIKLGIGEGPCNLILQYHPFVIDKGVRMWMMFEWHGGLE